MSECRRYYWDSESLCIYYEGSMISREVNVYLLVKRIMYTVVILHWLVSYRYDLYEN